MNFKKTGILLLAVLAMAVLSMAATENIKTKCPGQVAVLIETVKPVVFLEYHYFYGKGQNEIVAIKSPVKGLLSEIKVSEGSLVDAGQDLVVLNADMSEELKKLAAETVKAKKILTGRQSWKVKNEKAIQAAEKDYQKALDLLNEKKTLANRIIEAPLAGIVHLIMAAGGEADVDATIMEISNPQQFLFPVLLTAAESGALTVGEKLAGTGAGFSGEVAAEVIAVSETQATLRVSNSENKVKENVTLAFRKPKAEHADAIAVPTMATQKDSLGDFVYVVEKKKAKKLYITLGSVTGDKTMVLKGLAADTPLIISGFDCLADGKKIRVTNQEELAKEKTKALTQLKEKGKTPVAAKTEEILPADKSRFRVGITFARFTLNDKNLREMYPNWFQNIPGLELSVRIINNIDAWAAGKIYTEKDVTSFYNNVIKFKMIPLSLGLRYRPRKFGAFEPFVGAGVNFYSYSETIEGESDLEDTKGTALGFHLQGGSYFHFNRFLLRKIFPKNNVFLLGEVFLKYNMVKETLAELLPDGTDKLDLGGLEMGVGLVVKF